MKSCDSVLFLSFYGFWYGAGQLLCKTPWVLYPRNYAAGSCSGQSVLRSAPESGKSSSAQWCGEALLGWASGLKNRQDTHILATVITPASCSVEIRRMRKRITSSFSPSANDSSCSSTTSAQPESLAASSYRTHGAARGNLHT